MNSLILRNLTDCELLAEASRIDLPMVSELANRLDEYTSGEWVRRVELDGANEEIESLEAELSEAQSEVESLQDEVAELNERIKELEANEIPQS